MLHTHVLILNVVLPVGPGGPVVTEYFPVTICIAHALPSAAATHMSMLKNRRTGECTKLGIYTKFGLYICA